jgi:hypothetical protein
MKCNEESDIYTARKVIVLSFTFYTIISVKDVSTVSSHNSKDKPADSFDGKLGFNYLQCTRET